MMNRLMRAWGRLVIGHPGLLACLSLLLTIFLYANIHNLRTGTDLTDLFGCTIRNGRPPAKLAKSWATAISFL